MFDVGFGGEGMWWDSKPCGCESARRMCFVESFDGMVGGSLAACTLSSLDFRFYRLGGGNELMMFRAREAVDEVE